MLMIFAGYETTGNAMVFLMYNLATHPEVQEKVREEIDKTIENYVSCALQDDYLLTTYRKNQKSIS